jgi:tryptophanyl-tRNA synthetase
VQDGTSKMSKSAESDMSRINLLDDAKLITKKIKSAKTDTYEGLEYDNPARPEARNLMTMYALATGMSMVSDRGRCPHRETGSMEQSGTASAPYTVGGLLHQQRVVRSSSVGHLMQCCRRCLQESVMREVGPLQWGQFKPRLAEALVEHLAPIRANYAEVMKVGRGQCCVETRESPLCIC